MSIGALFGGVYDVYMCMSSVIHHTRIHLRVDYLFGMVDAHVYTDTYTGARTQTPTCTHIDMCTITYARKTTHIYTCTLSVYVHIHIHTHAQRAHMHVQSI